MIKTLLKITLSFILLVFLGCAGISAYFWYIWSSNLPYIGSLKDYRPPIITEILSDDGTTIGRLWEEKRMVIPLEAMPRHLIQAFVAAEDSRFFEHRGLDMKGIIRAIWKNLEAGRIEQGGSTITQQVTRTLLLKDAERTFRRKAREAILSVQIEKGFSKEEILFLYLNQIYLGEGSYGVEAAAQTFFGKSTKDLNLVESAMLAGLPQAPSRFSPMAHFDRAKARQRYALERMAQEGYITSQQLKEALEAPVTIQTSIKDTFKRAPYFSEHVRRYLLGKYGPDLLYRGGLKIYTTLNLAMQDAARDAVNRGLAELDKREGYRDPLHHLSPEEVTQYRQKVLQKGPPGPLRKDAVLEGLIEAVDDQKNEVAVWLGRDSGRITLSNMKWARRPNPQVSHEAASVKRPSQVLKKGDVILVRILAPIGQAPSPAVTIVPLESSSGLRGRIDTPGTTPTRWDLALEQTPLVQGALLCMIPETGEVKAMVGGRDYSQSQFNRAIQSRRQPGSAFKPIIYAAALDRGFTPADSILDSPFIAGNPYDDGAWKPKNYTDKFSGPTLLRTALAESRNVVTVKILKDMGVDYAIKYARTLGIESDLTPDLSLALGASGVSLLELATAYSVFANNGTLVKPLFIKKVEDRTGRVIEENTPEGKEVISPATAFVMTELLKAVIQEGTGTRLKVLNRPAAGKTGTTNSLRDAWFVGYTPGLLAGVWVGYDDLQEMSRGETGARAASPIWLYFLSEVMKSTPVVDFQVPSGVVFANIDAETGLLAGPQSEKTIFQAFIQGTEPKEYSTQKPSSLRSGEFFQMDMDASQGKD